MGGSERISREASQFGGEAHCPEDLGLPPSHRWDRLPDPKRVLYDALRAASGARGRRARGFKDRLLAAGRLLLRASLADREEAGA